MIAITQALATSYRAPGMFFRRRLGFARVFARPTLIMIAAIFKPSVKALYTVEKLTLPKRSSWPRPPRESEITGKLNATFDSESKLKMILNKTRITMTAPAVTK